MRFSTPDGNFNVLSLFDGISCLQIALRELGVVPTVYFASEIKKSGIEFTSYNFPDTKHLGDINGWRSWDLPRIDLVAFGSPCFPQGTPVLTGSGYRDISEVSKGDEVFTHNGNWRLVQDTNKRLFEGTMYRLTMAKDTFPIECTPEHPFYVLERFVKSNNSLGWSEPHWVEAKDLTTNHFIILPVQKECKDFDLTEDEAYLFGYYLAEGWLSKQKKKDGRQIYEILFGMHIKEQQHFKDLISRIKYRGRFKDKKELHIAWDFNCEGQVCKGILHNEFLYRRFLEAGNGAINKAVPISILRAPVNIQKAFLEGYMYGDGSFSGGYYTAKSLNIQMVYGLRALVLNVYGEVASIRFTKTPDTTTINGRVVNQRDRYDISWKLNRQKEVLSYSIGDLKVVKVQKIEKYNVSTFVYNLSVLEDNSYTVGAGYAVHNCKDFSSLNQLGLKGKGLAGRESSLFFVAFDILNVLRLRNPDIYFMAENVKGSNILSEYLRVRPVVVNNLEFACSSRTRLFFTNIGAEKRYDVLGNVYYEQRIPDSLGNSNITLRLDHPSLDEKGLWVDDDRVKKFLSSPRASGDIFTDEVPSQAGCVTCNRNLNKFGFSLVYQHGRYRYHTEGELRQMHSIPDWVVFPNKSLNVIQDLIGDGWAIGSAKYVLQHLPFVSKGF